MSSDLNDHWLMAYREFVDDSGLTWKVWDVKPAARHTPAVPIEAVGNSNNDGLRHVAPGWASGWLAFQSEETSRRLRPIPRNWETTGEFKLRDYLRNADPVRPR